MGKGLRVLVKGGNMRLPGKVKRDTNTIGEISEAAIITKFLQLGYIVLTPYGGNQRYDLIIEDSEGEFGVYNVSQLGLIKRILSSNFIQPTIMSQAKTDKCVIIGDNATISPYTATN